MGKSTFITKFTEQFILPNISSENMRACALDELPQSADGNTIMTTQPKFVPAEAVRVDLGNNVVANVRLIDCVGYLVAGAEGHTEGGKARMVQTPWSKEPMPFEESAEIGTRKVVTEHSSVAVLLTSDGSFGGISRENFTPAVDKLVLELREHSRPFVIVVNSAHPTDPETISFARELESKYSVSAVAINVAKLNSDDVITIFDKILQEFAFVGIEVDMPQWLTALPFDNEIIAEIVGEIERVGQDVQKIGDFDKGSILFENSPNFEPAVMNNIEMGEGKIRYTVTAKEGLFYKVLSQQCGMEIGSDFELISKIKSLATAKIKFDRLSSALDSVAETGYGVVEPDISELQLDDPQVVKQGANRWGVKIHATAPSLHIMRVDLETEISPLVGTQEQSQNLVQFLEAQNNDNPEGIWQTNMFGKTIHQLMSEGINTKISAMPLEAQKKMRKALTRIVNEGKGGIICILL